MIARSECLWQLTRALVQRSHHELWSSIGRAVSGVRTEFPHVLVIDKSNDGRYALGRRVVLTTR